ncbi:MAG: L,D-transpeptidase family protein [Novosphingobium sp.]|nr:L,D-transpeptidase family protein [Novosphingobium sp.]
MHASDWTIDQAQVLRTFISSSGDDALPVIGTDRLDHFIREGQGEALDAEANALALKYAKMQLLGVATAPYKAGWHIEDPDRDIDIEAWLHRALAGNAVSAFLSGVQPSHPDYAALRAAYASEKDPARKKTLARNMERWRWMPRSLGDDYILVNAPFFEARFWRGGELAGTWKVIVGKTSTPTPVFSAVVTGVTLNPSWYVPASIVRENGGRFSASKGFVYSSGQWRQKPGPGNALGQMKLVMPNPYNVYMHDTPSKDLFDKDVRAFSHGGIRTGDALGFAATLLEGRKNAREIAAVVKGRTTVTTDLAAPLPIYITYFTAAPDKNGVVKIQPDIYGRD